jgi:hypothetical protein
MRDRIISVSFDAAKQPTERFSILVELKLGETDIRTFGCTTRFMSSVANKRNGKPVRPLPSLTAKA